MKQEWYYLVDDGNQIGPFSSKMMVQLYEDEKIHKETYVWDGIFDRWRYFSTTSLYEQWQSNGTPLTVKERKSRMEKWGETIEKRKRRQQFFSQIFTIHSWKETNEVLISSQSREKRVQPWLYTRFAAVLLFLFVAFHALTMIWPEPPLIIPVQLLVVGIPVIVWVVFIMELQREGDMLPIFYAVLIFCSGFIAAFAYATAQFIGSSFVIILFLLLSIVVADRFFKKKDVPHALLVGTLLAIPYSLIEGSLLLHSGNEVVLTLFSLFGSFLVFGMLLALSYVYGYKTWKGIGLLAFALSLFALHQWFTAPLILTLFSLLGLIAASLLVYRTVVRHQQKAA